MEKQQLIKINSFLQKKWNEFLGSNSQIADMWITKISTAFDYDWDLNEFIYVYEDTIVELTYCAEDGVNKTIEVLVPNSIEDAELGAYLFGYFIAKYED